MFDELIQAFVYNARILAQNASTGKRGSAVAAVVTTHCLLEAVVALVARTRDLKAILLENRGDEGARVCS